MKQHHFISLIITIILIVVPFSSASADAGPGVKPSMTFVFNFNSQPEAASIVSGRLLYCNDPECKSYDSQDSGKPTSNYLPGVFNCSDYECWVVFPYPYSRKTYEYYRLSMTFQDKTRESNIFRQRGVNSRYLVSVDENGMDVRVVYGFGYFSHFDYLCFPVALAANILLEELVAVIYFWITKLRRFFRTVLVANIISLPVIWFLLRLFNLDQIQYMVLSEGFVVIFEAVYLYSKNKDFGVTLKHTSILSLLMNGVSFAAGYLFWLQLQ